MAHSLQVEAEDGAHLRVVVDNEHLSHLPNNLLLSPVVVTPSSAYFRSIPAEMRTRAMSAGALCLIAIAKPFTAEQFKTELGGLL